MRLSIKASLMLVLCTAFWGVTFPLVGNAVKFIDPSLFVTLRVILSAIVFLPFVLYRLKYINKYIFWGGLIVGTLTSLAYVFQSIGLMTLSSSRSAFITGTNVIFVPLLMPLFRLGYPNFLTLISVVLCLLGLYILTGADLSHLGVGDFWTLACAVSCALFVLFIQWFSIRIKDYRLFAFMQIIFAIPTAALFLRNVNFANVWNAQVIIGLIICALFATCLVFFWQTKYQQHVSAAKAALIFALEPVFATIFAFIINGEKITLHIILGGGLILLSIIFADLIILFREK